MSEQKNVEKVTDKAIKNNTFPNIATAYAILSSKDDDIGLDATATIKENNKKAP